MPSAGGKSMDGLNVCVFCLVFVFNLNFIMCCIRAVLCPLYLMDMLLKTIY